MKIEALLFDLFDTLLLIDKNTDFYVPSLRRLHEFLSRNSVNVSFDDFSRVYFEVRDRLYEEAEETLTEPHFNVRVSQTLNRLGYNLAVSDPVVKGATMVFAEEFMHHVSLDEEAIPVLQELRGRCRLGLVSNFAIPEGAWKLLERFGLKEFFDVVVISGEVNKRKPSPDIFRRALKALGVEASNAVFVGDTPSLDVKGARSAGIKTVLITREASTTDSGGLIWRPADETETYEPDAVISSLSQLPSILEKC